jgi:hypothetical protein
MSIYRGPGGSGDAVADSSSEISLIQELVSEAQEISDTVSTEADAVAAIYDSFDDRYLGSKNTAPSVDNDGDSLLIGALYFNTVDNAMKVWNGTAWLNAYASFSASDVAITGGSINGTTVGATTPSTGAFTSLSATNSVVVKAGNSSSPSVVPSGDTNTGVFFPAADTVSIATGGIERFRITSVGSTRVYNNLGVGGFANPWHTDYKAVEFSSGSISDSDGINIVYGAYAPSVGTWHYTNYNRPVKYEQSAFNGSHIRYGAATGVPGNTITWNQRLELTTGGSLILAGSTAQKATGTT